MYKSQANRSAGQAVSCNSTRQHWSRQIKAQWWLEIEATCENHGTIISELKPTTIVLDSFQVDKAVSFGIMWNKNSTFEQRNRCCSMYVFYSPDEQFLWVGALFFALLLLISGAAPQMTSTGYFPKVFGSFSSRAIKSHFQLYPLPNFYSIFFCKSLFTHSLYVWCTILFYHLKMQFVSSFPRLIFATYDHFLWPEIPQIYLCTRAGFLTYNQFKKQSIWMWLLKNCQYNLTRFVHYFLTLFLCFYLGSWAG